MDWKREGGGEVVKYRDESAFIPIRQRLSHRRIRRAQEWIAGMESKVINYSSDCQICISTFDN